MLPRDKLPSCASSSDELVQKGPAFSSTVTGEGNTTTWKLCGLDKNTCLTVFFDVSSSEKPDPSGNIYPQLYIQFLTRIVGESLKSYVPHWPTQYWQEYEPLLTYCRVNGVQLVACGSPLEVPRTVQAEGIRGAFKS